MVAAVPALVPDPTKVQEGAVTKPAFPPAWVKPNLPILLNVRRGAEGEFTSYAISKVSLPPGALYARINDAVATDKPSYSSVQVGRDRHVELHCDLVFVNHSCSPSLEFDTESFEVRVARDQPLREGDMLTFFYPSSEWSMAQAFECNCGSPNCLGSIQGASEIEEDVLRRYWLNPHIEELLAERREVR
jgi:hypothetical protein